MNMETRLELPVSLDAVLSTETAQVVQRVNADNLRLVLEWVVGQLQKQQVDEAASRGELKSLAEDVARLRDFGSQCRDDVFQIEKGQVRIRQPRH